MKEEYDHNFQKEKENAEKIYYRYKEGIFCPFFNEKITFNEIGWEHLSQYSNGNKRNRQDIVGRFRGVKYIETIIKNSHTLQGFKEMKLFVKIKINNRVEKKLKNTKDFEFLALVKTNDDTKRWRRYSIIIREIEGRKKIFYSIIPNWKTTGEKGNVILSL